VYLVYDIYYKYIYILVSAGLVVTFPCKQHHCPLAGTKLYCLVTNRHTGDTCSGLLHSVPSLDSNPQPLNHKSDVLPVSPLHYLWHWLRWVNEKGDAIDELMHIEVSNYWLSTEGWVCYSQFTCVFGRLRFS